VAGLTLPAAERKIAQLLKDGGFVLNPQVNISNHRGRQSVAVLGQVNRPGRYPIEGAGGNLTGMLAEAGGIGDTGADVVIVTGMRNGKPFRREIDGRQHVAERVAADDIELREAIPCSSTGPRRSTSTAKCRDPGGYRLERDDRHAGAADGGGMTGKGTSRGSCCIGATPPGKLRNPARLWMKMCAIRT